MERFNISKKLLNLLIVMVGSKILTFLAIPVKLREASKTFIWMLIDYKLHRNPKLL